MKLKILTEASGSLVSGYLIKAIKECGYIAVASDIDEFNHAKCLADEFIVFPDKNDNFLWNKIEKLLKDNKIDIVIPSFDETLLGWAERKRYFKNENIEIIISDINTLETFLDKWKAYEFCLKNDILTPKTSLNNEHSLIKPRFGRGGKDIYLNDNSINMENMISQEFIEGKEFTVDCFFDYEGNPVYLIPRVRLNVKDGKSTKGIVVKNDKIKEIIEKISENIKFIGPVNFQFIENDKNEVYFIECNPRIAGGMALGFAASENWINLIIKNLIYKEKIIPKEIKYGLRMARYYDECFF